MLKMGVTCKSTEKARATLAMLPKRTILDESEIDVAGDQRGPGYGVPTESLVEAVRLMAARERLLLDSVYSGNAFAGLLAGIRNGDYRAGQNVLFVLTGGTPGLFAYRLLIPIVADRTRELTFMDAEEF